MYILLINESMIERMKSLKYREISTIPDRAGSLSKHTKGMNGLTDLITTLANLCSETKSNDAN